MCGIALTLVAATGDRPQCASGELSVDDVVSSCRTTAERALRRRGPDSQRSTVRTWRDAQWRSQDADQPQMSTQDHHAIFTATVLHLRGVSSSVTVQPLIDVATGNILCWNGEVYSIDRAQLTAGSGFPLQPLPVLEHDQNDTQYMLALISALPSDSFVPSLTQLMAAVDGPFSFVLLHAASQTIWYGRDKMGRRSLVTGRRQVAGRQVIHVASLILPNEAEEQPTQWEEVATTGLWCIDFAAPSAANSSSSSSADNGAPFVLRHSPYPHVQASLPPLKTPLLSHAQLSLAHSFACGIDNLSVAPYTRPLEFEPHTMERLEAVAAQLQLPEPLASLPAAARLLYSALNESMSKRVGLLCTPSSPLHARVGVLFSGGIDCMVLALLAHRLLPPSEPIDLINVAFCGELRKSSINKFVPDRITSINGWRELKRCSEKDAKDQVAAAASTSGASASSTPAELVSRRWNLIHVNVSLAMLEQHRAHILSLLQPNCSVMDFNIASVLWFGTMAKGVLYEEPAGAIGADGTEQTDLGLIQSRLSRLGQEATPESALPKEDAKKDNNKGRVLPPELIAKLVAAARAHELESSPSASPDASPDTPSALLSPDATDDAGADASSPNPTRAAKSDRRSAKALEKKLIRAFFRKADRKAADEEIEDMLPSAEDFVLNGVEEEVDVQYDDLSPDAASASSTSASASSSSTSASSSLPSPRFYSSSAKVLLIGIGADEQLAGYGRHRTVWSREGPAGLASELAKDFARIWQRNLGRDDRIVSDSGREARHPFLDEQLVQLIHGMPLDQVCEFALPPGVGDKRILRQVARALGLESASKLVKRAMQFGSRIANKKVAGYVAMDDSIVIREIVNPFFLRASSTSSAASSKAKHARAYDASTPQSKLAKKVQRANGKPGFE